VSIPRCIHVLRAGLLPCAETRKQNIGALSTDTSDRIRFPNQGFRGHIYIDQERSTHANNACGAHLDAEKSIVDSSNPSDSRRLYGCRHREGGAMRQWWKMVALGAMAAIVVATPGAAFGGEGDDAPKGTTERVTERVTEQTQSRYGQPDVAESAEPNMDRERERLALRDGTGDNCVEDCDGDQARDRDRDQARDGTGDNCVGDCDGDQARDRDRDQARDGTGDNCVEDCDGDQIRDREQLRQRLHDCEDGCEAAWQFVRRHGWTLHVAF